MDREVLVSKLGMQLQLIVVVWSNLELHPSVGGRMKGAASVSWGFLACGFHLRRIPNSTF